MSTELWFPTPIYYCDLEQEDKALFDRIQTSINSIIPKLNFEVVDNDPVQSTIKNNENAKLILEDIPELREAMDKHLREYVSDGINDFIITGMAANKIRKGEYQSKKRNTPYDLSVIYFYQTNGEDGNLMFETDSSNLESTSLKFGFPFNNMFYRPKLGRLIIFPSWLNHRVHTNETDSERITFHFDLIKLISFVDRIMPDANNITQPTTFGTMTI